MPFGGIIRPMRLFLILPLFLVLAACATLDENECRAGNWYDIGVSDGAKGRSPDFILQHAKACNEFGIAPKAGPWREGRREGLKFYCTPRNAYDVGTRGAHLAPYCEGVDLATLHAANDRGLAMLFTGLRLIRNRAPSVEFFAHREAALARAREYAELAAT